MIPEDDRSYPVEAVPGEPLRESVWPRALSDAELRRAYQRTTGEPGDPDADALLAEIVRRELDV